MTGFEASGGWPVQNGLSCFRHIFAPSTPFKYDFIPLTSRQWVSTWKLRTGHITWCPVKLSTAFFMELGLPGQCSPHQFKSCLGMS